MDKETFWKIWKVAKEKIYLALRGKLPIPNGLDQKKYEAATSRMEWIAFIMDGHSTHIYSPEFNDDAKYHKIVVLNYVPHTTHVCQPLDSGMNEKIKVWPVHTGIYSAYYK